MVNVYPNSFITTAFWRKNKDKIGNQLSKEMGKDETVILSSLSYSIQSTLVQLQYLVMSE
jgi:hypothetical protein